MTIYWCLLCLMLLFQLLPINKRDSLFMSFIPYFLYGALRVGYGYDYELNEISYEYIHQYGIDNDAHQEIGYQTLCLICQSFRMLVFCTSAFTTFTFFMIIKEFVQPNYYWLAIILLFLAGDKLVFFQFSAIRNSIAIDLMLIGIVLYNRKAKLLYVLMIYLLAVLFHTSALIFIPLLVLFMLKLNYTSKAATLFIIGIIFFRLVVGLPIIYNFLSQFLIGDLEKYSDYLENIDFSHGASIFMLLFMVLYTSYILVTLVKYNSILDNKSSLIVRLSLTYSVAMALGPLGFRANQYFAFLFILAPVVLIQNLRLDKRIKYGLLSVVSIYLIYAFFIIFLKADNFPYQEYHSILDC